MKIWRRLLSGDGEDPDDAYENTLDLIRRTPDLAALWVAGGGIEGVMRAFTDAGAAERLVTVGRDLTVDTRAGLIDGTIRLVLSQPRRALPAATVETMVTSAAGTPLGFQQVLLPFDLWTADNV